MRTKVLSVTNKVLRFHTIVALILLSVGLHASFGRGFARIFITTTGTNVSYHSFGTYETIKLEQLSEFLQKAAFGPQGMPVWIYPNRNTTFLTVFDLIARMKSLGYWQITVAEDVNPTISEEELGFFQIDLQSMYANPKFYPAKGTPVPSASATTAPSKQ